MADSWFSLSRVDQVEALEFAAAKTGRPAHLLEKDNLADSNWKSCSPIRGLVSRMVLGLVSACTAFAAAGLFTGARISYKRAR